MTQPDPGDDPTLFPKAAGERLRDAREAQGLSLADVAARTRIPLRQLEAIESGDYTGLPSVTYAVGFAKAYARVVGVDEVTIGREVRHRDDEAVHRGEYQAYAIADPARTPSRSLVIVGAALALLILIGASLWFGTAWFRGDRTAATPTGEASAPPDAAPAASPAPPANATGQVVLTATGDVRLRVHDGDRTLFENTLKPGDHYDVPGDAAHPMIDIGRPDKLQVTVGGTPVPALGDGSHALKDVEISAAALRPRVGGAALPAPTPTATPTPRATSTSTSSRSSSRSSARKSREHRDTSDDDAPLNIAAPAPAPAEPAPLITGKPTP